MDTSNGSVGSSSPTAHQQLLSVGIFLASALLVPLLVAGIWFSFGQLTSAVEVKDPETSELEYAMYSTRTGEEGGSVIPASCDSAYEHYAGECAGWGGPLPSPTITSVQCINNGTQVNLGWSVVAGASRYLPRFAGADGWCGAYGGWWLGYGACNNDNYGANSAILNLTPGGWHRFWVHAGDPVSDPPNGTGNFLCPQTPGIGYACINNGTAVSVWWSAMSGAATYWPRISGVTPAQCAAIGWTMWIDGTTCYTNNYNATSAILPLNPGATHRAWVHSVSYGDVYSFFSDGGSTPYFNCPHQQAPIGWLDGASCGAAVNSGVVSGWTCDADSYGTAVNVHIYRDGPAGTGVYVGQVLANQYRADVAPHCGGTTAHGYTFTIPESLRDNNIHTYYAHAIDVDPWGGYGAAGNPVLSGSGAAAMCPIPPAVWVPYCTGGADINGNNWQWWQYTDSYGPRQWQFIRAGDGSCTPDAPSNTSLSCNVSASQITLSYNSSNATQYYPRIGGLTQAECTSNGWIWWTDNYMCYVDGWGPNGSKTFTGIANVGSRTFAGWTHGGTPVNWAKESRISNYTCPAGPVAPNVTLTAQNLTTGQTSPLSINVQGVEQARIDWISNADTCVRTAGPANFTVSGATGSDSDVDEPAPGGNTIFGVRCTNTASGLSTTRTVTVVNTTVAIAPPTLDLDATNDLIRQGQSANLVWSVTPTTIDALSCRITGAGMNVDLGSISGTPGVPITGTRSSVPLNSSQIFTFTCSAPVLAAPVSTTARVDVIPDQQEI